MTAILLCLDRYFDIANTEFTPRTSIKITRTSRRRILLKCLQKMQERGRKTINW